MSWEHRTPDGVGDIEHNDDGFTSSVSIPLDDDGYLSRQCPACEGPFKIHGDDYGTLPNDPVLTCPYCGHEEEHSSFMTPAQQERTEAAIQAIAEQYVHDTISKMFGQASGQPTRSPRRNSFISIETRYEPGTPPPIRTLPQFVEEQAKRTLRCSACGIRHALYSASSFCPICGPRPAARARRAG